jgi:hypothetical protein
VYLSKPITKQDYFVGKWLYVFLVVFIAFLAPMLLAALYSAFSNGWAEFLRDDPIIIPKIFLLAAVPGIVHASALVGLSAWNKTPWLVGVIYSGLYVFSDIFAIVMRATAASDAAPVVQATIAKLSIGGSISGVGQVILGKPPKTVGGNMFGDSALPSFLPLFLILAGVTVVGILAARSRIRAVEVVQG